MSVISATRKFEGQRGGLKWEPSSGISTDCSEKWLVLSDDKNDSWTEILDSVEVPQIGAQYIVDGAPLKVFVYGIDFEQSSENVLLWDLDIQFETPKPGSQGESGAPEKNPLARPVGVHWRLDKKEYPSFYDLDGNPFVNSAGDPYDEPLMVPFYSQTKIVTKNFAGYSNRKIFEYNNTTNSKTYAGADPYELLLTILPSEKKTENDVDFYTLTYELSHNPMKWHPYKVPDIGLRYYNAGGYPVMAEDGGFYHDKPVRLDGTGKRKETTGLVCNEFRKFREKDLNGFIPV